MAEVGSEKCAGSTPTNKTLRSESGSLSVAKRFVFTLKCQYNIRWVLLAFLPLAFSEW